MKCISRRVSELITLTECGEVVFEPESSWSEAMAALCKLYCTCCSKAVSKGYRVREIWFMLMLADGRVKAENFVFRQKTKLEAIEYLVQNYFRSNEIPLTSIQRLKYSVISEGYKVLYAEPSSDGISCSQ